MRGEAEQNKGDVTSCRKPMRARETEREGERVCFCITAASAQRERRGHNQFDREEEKEELGRKKGGQGVARGKEGSTSPRPSFKPVEVREEHSR